MTALDVFERLLAEDPCVRLLVQAVDALETGHIRLATILKKVDGSFVDIFIDTKRSNQFLTLTDFGHTYSEILDNDYKFSERNVQYVCQTFDVVWKSGALEVRCRPDEVFACIIGLSQACQALLACTIGTCSAEAPYFSEVAIAAMRPPTTKETLTSLLADYNIDYRENMKIEIKDRNVTVDLVANYGRATTAIMVPESSFYPKVFLRRADHAFAVHSDLRDARYDAFRVSVVSEDDMEQHIRSDSLQRLAEVSILSLPSQIQANMLRLN